MASTGREYGELGDLLLARTPGYLDDIMKLTVAQSEGVKDLEAGFLLSALEILREGDVPGLSEMSKSALRDFLASARGHTVRVIGRHTYICVRRGGAAFVLERAGELTSFDMLGSSANDITAFDTF